MCSFLLVLYEKYIFFYIYINSVEKLDQMAPQLLIKKTQTVSI